MHNDKAAGLVAGIGRRMFYGWVIVAVAGLGVFAGGPGQSHTFSVFIGPISRDLGLSHSTIAAAYGLATLVAAFALPRMGRFVDRHGARRVLLVVTLLLGIASALFGAVAGVLTLALGFAAVRFLGQGSLMLIPANLVSQWFARKRGLAMSLMALGFGFSMAVHPPLSQALIAWFGWRSAWIILGLMTWVLMLPAVYLFVYDRPEQLGLKPDGDTDEPADGDETVQAATDGLTLHAALRTPTFYLLSASWFSTAMLVTTLHFYQVTLMTAQGVSGEAAARVFVISAVCMVAMMPFVGRLFDSMPTRFVIALTLLVTVCSLVGVTLVTDTLSAGVYALVFGINNALSMTMFGYVWPRYFGRRHLGAIQGTGQMIGVVGASLGPIPVGLAFNAFGSATMTLRLLALLPFVIAIITALALRTPSSIKAFEHLE